MKQYIIIGNSAAGISAVEAIRRRDKDSKIIIFSDEDYSAYCRCLISYYLAGDIKEDKIFYRPGSFYKENNIELFLNKRVSRIDPKKSRIICEDKTQFNYDALLVATGASARIPQELKGNKKRGVFSFRTMKDTKEIMGLLPVTSAASVLGGGLVGLKAAYGLKKRNVAVKVVVKSRQILSQMLDFTAAGLVQKRLEDNGVEIILGEDVAEIIGEGEIKAIKLGSGKVFESSLIVIGKGVKPNIELIKDTETKFNEGIIADNSMRTNTENIYAAGDCAESFDIALGVNSINALWPVAVEQGRIAGANMAGDSLNYEGSVGMNSIEFFGLPAISLGVFKTKENETGIEEIKDYDEKMPLYKKIILKGNVIVGATFVGNIKNTGVFLRLIREKIDISDFKDKLLQENFGYPVIMDLIKDKERLYVK